MKIRVTGLPEQVEIMTAVIEEYCGVKYLKNRVRDPRAFVNEKKIEAFQKEIESFNSLRGKPSGVQGF